MLRDVEVALPPLIAGLEVPLSTSSAAAIEVATREIVALDREHSDQLRALGVLLLRTESVASSKIESIDAGIDDYARALHGSRANNAATSMAAATDALATLMGAADRDRVITLGPVLQAHAVLMAPHPEDARDAGKVREVQNWIGGSDHSLRNALYVPPPPDRLDAALDDLIQFANLAAAPALALAAIAHAQFESIHPFVDGNGRIGRALINVILRCRGLTSDVVVPIASALVAHRDRYFDLLNAYRAGETTPLIEQFASATAIAAAQSRTTATRLAAVPGQWRDQLGGVRSKSAASRLLEVLPARPIVSAEDAVALIGGPTSSVYAAMERLAAAGVLRALTDRRRNQIWGAAAILDELDDLGGRIARDAR